MQVLAEAVNATKSIDDGKLADYLRGHTFDSIMFKGVKFGKNGEWVPRTSCRCNITISPMPPISKLGAA